MKEERIILARAEELEPNLEAVKVLPKKLQIQIDGLKELESETGLEFVKDGDFAAIEKALHLIPISDRETPIGIQNTDEDSEIFSEWIRSELYVRDHGSIEKPKTGAPKYDNFDPVLPGDLIRTLVDRQYEIDRFLMKFQGQQVFRDYISLSKGKITVKKDASDAITDKLITRATEIQEKAYLALKALKSDIEKLEKENGLPSGFALEAIQHDNKYFLYNSKFLTL